MFHHLCWIVKSRLMDIKGEWFSPWKGFPPEKEIFTDKKPRIFTPPTTPQSPLNYFWSMKIREKWLEGGRTEFPTIKGWQGLYLFSGDSFSWKGKLQNSFSRVAYYSLKNFMSLCLLPCADSGFMELHDNSKVTNEISEYHPTPLLTPSALFPISHLDLSE